MPPPSPRVVEVFQLFYVVVAEIGDSVGPDPLRLPQFSES